MVDETEGFRRQKVAEINSQVASDDPEAERKRLEAIHGKVYNTSEVASEFDILAFMAPYVVVTSRRTMQKGTLEFQHHPRFYFNFRPYKE